MNEAFNEQRDQPLQDLKMVCCGFFTVGSFDKVQSIQQTIHPEYFLNNKSHQFFELLSKL